mgnify:FL=1|tara:strand:- start:3443 stop:3721 length:279 start_codon:yes stop_codon:yes gene_type:complete
MKKPYEHFQIDLHKFIRTFRADDIKSDDLIWHRDENERLIYVIHVDPGWTFQRDNRLPQKMVSNKTVIRIEAGEYHRITKGSGVCVLYIEEK